jgi:hypothetical protein
VLLSYVVRASVLNGLLSGQARTPMHLKESARAGGEVGRFF